tara:strand:- start:952 stop:1239 length:288 start_codon:yes stop_codon:yes gene_type:complete
LVKLKEQIMEVDFAEVSDNYMALPEEEKNIVRKGMAGPMGAIIGKVFGPEFMEGIGTFAAPTPAAPTPKKRTMAPTMPQQQPQAKPQGLAARPQR